MEDVKSYLCANFPNFWCICTIQECKWKESLLCKRCHTNMGTNILLPLKSTAQLLQSLYLSKVSAPTPGILLFVTWRNQKRLCLVAYTTLHNPFLNFAMLIFISSQISSTTTQLHLPQRMQDTHPIWMVNHNVNLTLIVSLTLPWPLYQWKNQKLFSQNTQGTIVTIFSLTCYLILGYLISVQKNILMARQDS